MGRGETGCTHLQEYVDEQVMATGGSECGREVVGAATHGWWSEGMNHEQTTLLEADGNRDR